MNVLKLLSQFLLLIIKREENHQQHHCHQEHQYIQIHLNQFTKLLQLLKQKHIQMEMASNYQVK